MRAILAMLLVLALTVPTCDELPRDHKGTLTVVSGGLLRVGVVNNPPWVDYDQQHVSGVEVELIEKLAQELGAEIRWIRGSENELMPALERFELHLVIGGLTEDTPWNNRVGLSRPYFTTRFVVGVPPGQELESIAGQRVAVQEGSVLVSMVRDQGATAVRVSSLSAAEAEAVVAPHWQLEHLGRESTGIELHRRRHVMAVPPGENRWLMWLDRFLHREAAESVDRLRQAEGSL